MKRKLNNPQIEHATCKSDGSRLVTSPKLENTVRELSDGLNATWTGG